MLEGVQERSKQATLMLQVLQSGNPSEGIIQELHLILSLETEEERCAILRCTLRVFNMSMAHLHAMALKSSKYAF